MGFVAGAVMLIFTHNGYGGNVHAPAVSYYTTLDECEFARGLVALRAEAVSLADKLTVVCLATGARP
jgi:hypothetical protein